MGIATALGPFFAGVVIGHSVQAREVGYIFFAREPIQIGETTFAKGDGIVVAPEIANPSELTGAKGFSADARFMRLDGGRPTGEWRSGRMDFAKLNRFAPIGKQDSSAWTVEPPQMTGLARLVAGPPGQHGDQRCDFLQRQTLADQACGEGRSDCREIADLAFEFHNSSHCDEINRHARGEPSRTEQLLAGWQAFIDKKSGGTCHPGPPGPNPLCNRLNRARDVDILTRTAVFEADGTNTNLARNKCEKQFIALTIRNIAYSQDCANPKARWSVKSGCRYVGDVTSVATKPSEFNIWFPRESLTTRITGCFMRADADLVEWPKSKMISNPERAKRAFQVRKEDYLRTFESMVEMTDPDAQVARLFRVTRNQKELPAAEEHSVLGELKFYYHPVGMDKCDPSVYDKTVFVSMGYVTKNGRHYLMSGLRFTPGSATDHGVAVESIYPLERRTKSVGAPDEWTNEFDSLRGGLISEGQVDRSMNNTCWPSRTSRCPTVGSLGPRKMPRWAMSPENESYHLSCVNVGDPSRVEWTFQGSCDPGIVIPVVVDEPAAP